MKEKVKKNIYLFYKHPNNRGKGEVCEHHWMSTTEFEYYENSYPDIYFFR